MSALGLGAVILDMWNNGGPVTLRKPNKISEEEEMDPSIVISTKCNDKVLLELGCCRHSSTVDPSISSPSVPKQQMLLVLS